MRYNYRICIIHSILKKYYLIERFLWGKYIKAYSSITGPVGDGATVGSVVGLVVGTSVGLVVGSVVGVSVGSSPFSSGVHVIAIPHFTTLWSGLYTSLVVVAHNLNGCPAFSTVRFWRITASLRHSHIFAKARS